jgi:PBSX family phage terminase large subunit
MRIDLSPWQTTVWEDKHRYKVINAGRRAGKTMLVTMRMVDFATRHNEVKIWYIAPTYKQAKQIVWEMLHTYIPKPLIARKNETELVVVLKNGSKIELKGADNPDSLRGVGIDLIMFDEVAFFSRWSECWKILRPTLADSAADCWFISTPNGFNHFKELADNYVVSEDRGIFKEEDHAYYHFTTYDNPYIDVDEIELMKAELDDDSFSQEILGEFRKMVGLIFKDFKRETHMVKIPFEKFDSNWTYTRALDLGYTHKTALGYFAISPDQTEMYLYDGMYQENFTEQEIANACIVKDSGKVITNPVADSAQPMQIEELSKLGVNFNPVEKGPDSVKYGIVKVAELLKIRQDTGKPTLMFNKNLPWIADEFEKYRWMERKTDGVIKEVPYKKDDDACFIAGTKILTSLGEKNIEDITNEDMIITPFGLSKTTGSYPTGKKKVVDCGVFTSTPSHKVLTNKGIVRVDALGYNHNICQKQFIFRESLIDAILNLKIGQIDFIFNALLTRNLEAKRDFYIERYGNTTTVKYQKDLKFIILMAILPIMKYLTLSVSVIVNTLKNTVGVIGTGLRNIKKRLLKKQNNGEKTTQKKQRKLTQLLLKRDGKTGWGRKPLRFVPFVKKNIKHTFLEEANTVIKIAKQQPLEEKEVYNLATNHGMYFANGVLVSNCDMIRYFAMSYRKKAEKRRKSRHRQLLYSTMGRIFS